MGKGIRKKDDIPLRTILDWYDAWLRDESPGKVAAAMDVTLETVRRWSNDVPDMKSARELAESRRGNRSSFSGYVFNRLSAEAQETWDRIRFWDDGEGAFEKVNEILQNKPVRLIQELFIHALVRSSFDVSTALQMICLSRTQLENWRVNDLGFRQLIEEIQWHKKNFFEKSLVGLIEEKHPAAIIFANKTFNADRGYNEKIQLEHSGRVETAQFSIDDLELDIETRKKILQAMRVRQAKLNPATAKALPANTEAELVEV